VLLFPYVATPQLLLQIAIPLCGSLLVVPSHDYSLALLVHIIGPYSLLAVPHPYCFLVFVFILFFNRVLLAPPCCCYFSLVIPLVIVPCLLMVVLRLGVSQDITPSFFVFFASSLWSYNQQAKANKQGECF